MTEINFQDMVAHCTELEQFYAARNANNDKIDIMYYLKWNAPARSDGAAIQKVTINAQPRNALDGARQLLTAATPIFSIPTDKNMGNKEQSDKLEKAANTMWFLAGRQRGKPLEYDAVGLGLRRDEIHIGIMRTADMLENAQGSSPSNLARLERLAKVTPLYFEVYDPQTGYPEYDSYGLVGYFRKVKVKSAKVLDAWGDLATAAGMNASNRWEDVTLCEWMDYSTRAVWVEGASQPIYNGEHGLGVLPVVCKTLNGSPTVGKAADEQVQPLLYGIMKSGLWESANLYATIADTNALAIAANPTFVENLQDPDDPPRTDYSVLGGVLRLRMGETHQPMVKNAIDQAILTQAQRIDGQMEEASIYKATLGQPVGGGNAPYSSVALLNQIGRQPLISIQKGASWAFADAMQVGFALLKLGGKQAKIKGESVIDIAPADIPDDLVIECMVDIKLPTDDRQNAMVAAQLVGSNLADKAWVRENLLGMGQSTDIEKNIFFDKMLEQKMMTMLEMQKAMMQQELQQRMMQMQGQLQPGMPPQGQPPMSQGMPPEMQQGMNPEQIGAGLPAMPMTEPTTPEGMPPGMGPEPEAAMMGGM